jgi:methylenetetrahydrofolate dehydrogenase (NADP+)/methenyltetrahydrofolate cyclohydrolase
MHEWLAPEFFYARFSDIIAYVMVQIVDGKKIADGILDGLKTEIGKLSFAPKLVVFLVGSNPSSVSYIQAKEKKAKEIGVEVKIKRLSEDISQKELEREIEIAAGGNRTSGILVQLPLPAGMNVQAVLDTVPPELDVDALTTRNKNDIIKKGEALFVPPAASAVLEILDYHSVDLTKKAILIVGTGDLVGKPLAALLLKRKAGFELANRYTENLDELLKKADVVITAVGKAGLITGDKLKKGAIVIDAGTVGSPSGAVLGDVEESSVRPKCSLLSPVPGGVGPVTIAKLFENLVASARRKTGSE